jgi:hypothetical protein
MYLSTESIHSAYIYSIVARLESFGFSSVLVLVRAWAIWGTRKRVTKILAWSYVCYILMLLTGSAHNLSAKKSGLFSPFFYSEKWMHFGSAVSVPRRDSCLRDDDAQYVIVV